MDRFEPIAFAILRIVAGLMFATHGSQKLLGYPPGGSGHLPPLMIVGGCIELIGGLLITIGLLARYAALVAGGEMAYAYLTVHAPHGPLPLVNKGELAVLYGVVWLFIIFHGSGIWSVDAALRGRTAPVTPPSSGAARP